jgi:hypothetical protein
MTLQGILRNMSLHLPENYELTVGPKSHSVYDYYKLIKVVLIGDSRSLKLVLNIPIRTAEQQFVLYKLSVLPVQVSADTYAK